MALAAEATTLDPTESSAGVDFYMIGNLFEQLTRVDPRGNTVNWLAEGCSSISRSLASVLLPTGNTQ